MSLHSHDNKIVEIIKKREDKSLTVHAAIFTPKYCKSKLKPSELQDFIEKLLESAAQRFGLNLILFIYAEFSNFRANFYLG